MFTELCGISVGVIWLYAILIFVAPDWFFGTYLYKNDIWTKFRIAHAASIPNQNIVTHLLWGVSLSWISWGGVGYLAAIYFLNDPAHRSAFSAWNAILWACWAMLDHYIRSKGLYSGFASAANCILTIGLTLAWFVVAVSI